jgi:hypothetical protein
MKKEKQEIRIENNKKKGSQPKNTQIKDKFFYNV